MRLSVIFSLLAIFFSLSRAVSAGSGWRDDLSERLAFSLLELPKVEIKDGSVPHVVRITNTGKASLSYRARGAGMPILYFESLVDGEWKASGWDWCGTGVEEFSLKPGASADMKLLFGSVDTGTRVFAIFTDNESGRSSAVMLLEIL